MVLERSNCKEGHQEALRCNQEGERSKMHAPPGVFHFIQPIGVNSLFNDKWIHHVCQLLPHHNHSLDYVLSKLPKLHITSPFMHKILRFEIIPCQCPLVGIQGMGQGPPQYKWQVVHAFEVPLRIEHEVMYIVSPIALYPNAIVIIVDCQNKINVWWCNEVSARLRVFHCTF